MIEAGDSDFLEIEFLPTTLGNHECSVVLIDEGVGEMEYIIES